jgi:hypothetical protein
LDREKPRLTDHFRSDPTIGEDFQKHGLRQAAIDEVDLAAPALRASTAERTFGIMPPEIVPSAMSSVD